MYLLVIYLRTVSMSEYLTLMKDIRSIKNFDISGRKYFSLTLGTLLAIVRMNFQKSRNNFR